MPDGKTIGYHKKAISWLYVDGHASLEEPVYLSITLDKANYKWARK
jgi:prepilin-type processing-associated H-X9-DG protein